MSELMHRYIVLLGSNMGKRELMLHDAIEELKKTSIALKPGFVAETKPWGNPDQPNYLNQGIQIITPLPPEEFLQKCLAIEKKYGRLRSGDRNQARTLDIDILVWNGGIFRSSILEIPHPRMHMRDFALMAVKQFDPLWNHPVLNKGLDEMLSTFAPS